MILAAALSMMAATVPPATTHICWIDRVVVDGTGVLILFAKGVPLPSGETRVHGEVGMILYPQTSGHDGCSVTVARQGARIGVQAQSHFFAYGITPEPEIRKEWIPADPAR